MTKRTKAVVLGVGAERGLGAAASRRFAKEGCHVLVAGRTPAKIDKVVETIRRDGGSATAVPTDGTKETEVIALFDRAMADDGDELALGHCAHQRAEGEADNAVGELGGSVGARLGAEVRRQLGDVEADDALLLRESAHDLADFVPAQAARLGSAHS